MEGILAIIFIFGGGTLFLLATSPIGKAIAERIRSSGPAPAPDPELLAEVDSLRHDVAELAERLDFAERLLTSKREGVQQLPGGEG
jgi:hypothetical protein